MIAKLCSERHYVQKYFLERWGLDEGQEEMSKDVFLSFWKKFYELFLSIDINNGKQGL